MSIAHRFSFTTLWIYTILKLICAVCTFHFSFTTLWIYTILKHSSLPGAEGGVSLPYGFTLFSNADQGCTPPSDVSLPYGFTLFSNTPLTVMGTIQFHYLMDLHYSQTHDLSFFVLLSFHYLMDLHYSQTIEEITTTSPCASETVSLPSGFTLFSNNTSAALHRFRFHYLMDLHYSQTSNKLRPLYSAGQIHKI